MVFVGVGVFVAGVLGCKLIFPPTPGLGNNPLDPNKSRTLGSRIKII